MTMSSWAEFGSKSRLEIAVRWAEDSEPREQRPAHGGWSIGQLRLTVNHHVLTRNEAAASGSEAVTWYLLPVFEWVAKNWSALLHEERFAWRENSAAPAATAVFLALRRLIDVDEHLPSGESYARVQDWWMRHALRSADSSALYPDVVFRRLQDDIEISWTGRQPDYSPDGFRFSLMPGAATLPVSQVAGPLWEALNWVVASAEQLRLAEQDRSALAALRKRISALKRLSASAMEACYLPERLFSELSSIRQTIHLNDRSKRLKTAPALEKLDDAVLMFGGVSPDLGLKDMNTLLMLLASRMNGKEDEKLSALVNEAIGAPSGVPYQEGYDLAEEILDELSLPGSASFVDIRALVARWRIQVIERALRTSTIRGVAIAGSGYGPLILINKTSDYNASEVGKRFTLAHELFHVLYDRSRARRITHVSGPWASPGVEKRANAFAAMFLMPRPLLKRSFGESQVDESSVEIAAREMQVGVSALVEHLYNTSVIDEAARDKFRMLETTAHLKLATAKPSNAV